MNAPTPRVLLADLLARTQHGARRGLKTRYHGPGPSQAIPRRVDPVLAQEIGSIIKLADSKGVDLIKSKLQATFGDGVYLTMGSANRVRRREFARVMRHAVEDLLAGQYPDVQIVIRWVNDVRASMLTHAVIGWRCLVTYAVKQ